MFLGQIQPRNMSIFTTGNPFALLHKAGRIRQDPYVEYQQTLSSK